jgi:N utilization substance protein A
MKIIILEERQMNNEFFDALLLLEKEKGIQASYLIEKIANAIATAIRKDYPGNENINVDINLEKRKFKISVTKTCVEEVENPALEIIFEEALKHSKKAMIGNPVEIKLETKQFGRIVAQNAKHIIRQGIREAERGQLLEQFQKKINQVLAVKVLKIEPGTGNALVEIDKNEVMLFKNEQIPDEVLVEGMHIKVYVSDVIATEKRCSLKISRTHKDLVKHLFINEVPEISEGIVEIKAISREPGSRSKLAVYSSKEDVDAVGACIGPKGSRVSNIVDELAGEKIDVVNWSEVPEEFISAALAPANVVEVIIPDENVRACSVKVPDHQISLAIGNKGQNAKLAARLTGFKIDIKPESGYYGE